MIQQEEIYASQFYKELSIEFSNNKSLISKIFGFSKGAKTTNVDIKLLKAGTQSQCTIALDARHCSINCFSNGMKKSRATGPEFYTQFKDNGKIIATARTTNKSQTIEAIKDWINNNDLEELYANHHFIDVQKRNLEKLLLLLNENYPELLNIEQNELIEDYASSFSLMFADKKRSCIVNFYGNNGNPQYTFKWDNSPLLKTNSLVINRISGLLKMWVVDKEMPSELELKYPEITFNKLAQYYEQGNGIEGEFILSWDEIESFYKKIHHENENEILGLIQQMRLKGFDKTLRAGQSLYTLVLSRSRRHGLRNDQASIFVSFSFIKSAMEIRTSDGEKMDFDTIFFNDTLENLMLKLQKEDID